MGTSNKQGTAITPEAAGYGGLKAIALGDTPIKLAFALATTTRAREGVTLDEYRVRSLAVGMPLWFRPMSVTDAQWFVRQPGTARSQRRGVTHVCAHRAKRGTIERCMGGHAARGEPCTFEFRSVGDGVRRWRNEPDAHTAPDFDGNAAATVKAARTAARQHVAVLRGKGFTAADMLATKSIAWLVEAGLVQLADLGGRKPRKARTGKAAGRALVEPTTDAPQLPTVPTQQPTSDDDNS